MASWGLGTRRRCRPCSVAVCQELTTLTRTIESAASCSSHQLQDPLEELQHDETVLRNMIESAKSLRSNDDLRNELENEIRQGMKDIASQNRQEQNRRERFVCLRRAVEEVDIAAAGQHLERLIQKYLRDHHTHQSCSLESGSERAYHQKGQQGYVSPPTHACTTD